MRITRWWTTSLPRKVSLLFGLAVIVGTELARPFRSASIAFDSQVAVLHFERIVAGRQLEVFLSTTPKPLLTLVAAALTLSLNASAADITGTVLESMDSGGYTYLLIKTPAGEKKWAAVTKTTVKKGQTATVTNSMDMMNFESPSLKRKFDVIAFGMLGDGAAPAAAAAAPAAATKDAAKAVPPGPAHGGRAEVKGPIKVAKAAGADARTIAEVYAQKAALKDKEVVVRGKVVKYNAAILNRNWAHLRDGSGNAKDGSDDLTVLLKDESAVGQVITARGKVVLNKDLGGMYKFAVCLEDAVLVK